MGFKCLAAWGRKAALTNETKDAIGSEPFKERGSRDSSSVLTKAVFYQQSEQI